MLHVCILTFAARLLVLVVDELVIVLVVVLVWVLKVATSPRHIRKKENFLWAFGIT